MHKVSTRRQHARLRKTPRSHLSATHATRAAAPGDGLEIHALVNGYAEEGLMLPRTIEEIEAAIADYVVVVDRHERVKACAALVEYSPSLAEIASVAVAPDAQGIGLGSMAVRSVEAMARQRQLEEVFALSLAGRFFESLGYDEAPLALFPEKISRYEALAARGVAITPKGCFRKALT